MRKLIAAVVVALLSLSMPAWADFQGAYAPGNWSSATSTGVPPVGGGGFVSSFSSTTLVLTGGDILNPDAGNSGCTSPEPCSFEWTITATGQPLTFHWSLDDTLDFYAALIAGGEDDVFGIILNGLHVPLDLLLGPLVQSGDKVVNPTAGSTFGFYIDCGSCDSGALSQILDPAGRGASIVTITSFAAPEPPTLALFAAAALAGFGTLRRSGTGKNATPVSN